MPSETDKIRLDFFYCFKEKEFVIRFESNSQAVAYQSRNNESRIFSDQRHDVWLPVSPDMKYLRSSSLGMALVFESEAAAAKWQAHTILGKLVTFEGSDHGVYFERDWSNGRLKDKIGDFRTSLGPPSVISKAHTRPNSSHGDRFEINVPEQRGSEWKD